MMTEIMTLDFQALDVVFDVGLSVAKGELGTLYLQTNTPSGHSVTRISMHPQVAERLRDWLVAQYPDGVWHEWSE